jgi:hypothetical protein
VDVRSGVLTALIPAREYKPQAPANAFFFEADHLVARLPQADGAPPGMPIGLPPNRYRYASTNFLFAPSGRHYRKEQHDGLTVQIPIPGKAYTLVTLREPDNSSLLIWLFQRSDTDEAALRLRTRRGKSRVTADVHVPALRDNGKAVTPDEANDILGRLVRVMSIGTGSRVQWIARDTIGAPGPTTERLHVSRRTGGFSLIPVIRLGQHFDVMTFLQQAYANYTIRRAQFRLDKTTDAYIGARENADDFMETRAVRLAIALEALREALSVHSEGRSGHIGDLVTKAVRPLVEILVKAARAALTGAGLPEDILTDKELQSRGFSFFRKTFRQQIAGLVAQLRMAPLPNEEIGAFIRSRDSLVHRGSFECDNEDTASLSRDERSSRITEEFWADFHVLDRIFMGVLGFRGHFVDARDATGHTVTTVAYLDPPPPTDQATTAPTTHAETHSADPTAP